MLYNIPVGLHAQMLSFCLVLKPLRVVLASYACGLSLVRIHCQHIRMQQEHPISCYDQAGVVALHL